MKVIVIVAAIAMSGLLATNGARGEDGRMANDDRGVHPHQGNCPVGMCSTHGGSFANNVKNCSPSNCRQGGAYGGVAQAKKPDSAVQKAPLSPGRPFIKTGIELFNGGEYQAAITEFQKAVDADPENSHAYEWLGRTRLRTGEHLEAIADSDHALKFNPRNLAALNTRGIAYLSSSNFGRALADFEAVLAIDPSNATAYSFRGSTYSQMGDPRRGLEDVNIAIKLNPKYPFAYGNLGGIYNKLQQYEQALEAFNKQLQLDPIGNVSVFNGRGWSYLSLGDSDSALADFNRALAIVPNDGASLGNRARIYVEKGQYDLALKDLTQSKRLLPNNVNPLVWEAKAYELSGNLQAARDDYKAILDLNPAHGVAMAGVDRLDHKIAIANGTVKSNANLTHFRTALIIGNSHYAAIDKLDNPEHDAKLLAETLQRLGFEKVHLVIDGSRDAMVAALKAFGETAATADWAVVYFAGHGIEFDGSNYLVPIDVKYEEDADIPKESVALDVVLDAVGGAKKLRLVILDACRENPFVPDMKKTGSSTIGRGLARIEPESGTLVAFATKHGRTATDGLGQDSPFATALVERMLTPGVEITQLFRLVHDQVYASTNKEQEPFTYGQLPAEQFYFKQ